MKRVVITGLGIVSSIGIGKEAVRESLRQGQSGIVFSPEYHDLGFRSHVHGALEIDLGEVIDRKHKRFMGDSASYNYIALKEAVDDAELDDEIGFLKNALNLKNALKLMVPWWLLNGRPKICYQSSFY